MKYRLKLVILAHLLPFYHPWKPQKQNLKNEKKCWRYNHFTQVYQKLRLRQTEFFAILGHFVHFFVPKNQIFEKMKKLSGDVIILHRCTKSHDHMMYASWDVEWDRHNFLSFWTIFLEKSTKQRKVLKVLWEKY